MTSVNRNPGISPSTLRPIDARPDVQVKSGNIAQTTAKTGQNQFTLSGTINNVSVVATALELRVGGAAVRVPQVKGDTPASVAKKLSTMLPEGFNAEIKPGARADAPVTVTINAVAPPKLPDVSVTSGNIAQNAVKTGPNAFTLNGTINNVSVVATALRLNVNGQAVSVPQVKGDTGASVAAKLAAKLPAGFKAEVSAGVGGSVTVKIVDAPAPKKSGGWVPRGG
jgi:phage tail sheath gpL-like